MSNFAANFWSGLAAGLLAPMLILVSSKLFVRWTARPGHPTAAPGSNSATDHSIQTGPVYGSNKSTVNDNRQYTTTLVQQYLEQERPNRSTTKDSEVDNWWILFAGLIGVTIGLLYVLYAPVFIAAAAGMCVSLIITAVVTGRRTKALLADWPEGASQALASVVIAVVGTVYAGIALLNSQKGTINFSTLQAAARLGFDPEPAETAASENAPAIFVAKLMRAGRSITEAFGIDGWYFFFGQTAAVIFIFEVLVLVLYRLLEWNTFLRFATRTTRNRKAFRRAMAFPEKKWTTLVVTLIGVSLAALLGSQWLFNGLPTRFTGLGG